MMQTAMKRFYRVAAAASGVQMIVVAVCLAAAVQLRAQVPAKPDENKPPAASQNSSADTSRPPAGDSANPFPGDTSNVPVLPSANAPALPPGTSYGAETPELPLPGDDQDPVRSPDDIAPPAESATPGPQGQWSSSLTGLDKVLPQPGDDQSEKKKHRFGRETPPPAPVPEETAPEDIRVGTFYLQTHDWKGALSRFESALVLAPDNPEVYWGLAECDRHLGKLADARVNYEKVVEYDPGSHHAKDARKALEDPEIANGKNAAPSPAATTDSQQ